MLFFNVTPSSPIKPFLKVKLFNSIVADTKSLALKEYAKSSRKLELEILTNGDGLALATNSGKDYNKRLQNLQQKYANLAVMVCGQTLKRVQREKGKKLDLLPDTNVVSSAVNQMVKRQRNGWSYIRI